MPLLKNLPLIAFYLVTAASTLAQETDARLHSDGKGWGLDQAKIADSKRPRVLLIGDSILNGYLKGVSQALEGKAYVDAWVNPYNQGNTQLGQLTTEVLSHGPYDVIHFNMGLHGWQKGRIPEGQFEALTKKWVDTLRAVNPKAKLIWASSTPITTKGKPEELDAEANPIILDHNAMAAKVMKDENVPIDDLYGVMLSHLSMARGDQFHWKPEGVALQVQAVSQAVADALK